MYRVLMWTAPGTGPANLYNPGWASASVANSRVGSSPAASGACYRQHSLNHQRTSQNLCLPSSHSFQAYGLKPTRGHEMGQAKNGTASNRDNFGKRGLYSVFSGIGLNNSPAAETAPFGRW